MRLFGNRKGHDMKMHVLIGLSVVAAAYYLNSIYQWVDLPTENMLLLQLAGIAAVYSAMPDIDQPGSIINKWVTVALVGVVVLAFMGYLYPHYGIISAVVLGLLRLIEHRTLVHSVLGALVVSLPLLYLGKLQFGVGIIAFLSHIIADNEFSWGWEKDSRLW